MPRLVLASASLPAFAQDKKASNSVEQAALKLEQQWEDALLKSDVAALERIYDDSLIYTHSSGAVDNKSVYVGNIKSGATKYESMKRDDIKVSVYDADNYSGDSQSFTEGEHANLGKLASRVSSMKIELISKQ